jgi:hypothetical protein
MQPATRGGRTETRPPPLQAECSTLWRRGRPSWTICERDNRPPDTFLYVGNEVAIFSNSASFNPTVLLATAEDCEALRETRVGAVRALASCTRPLLHLWKVRTWGNPSTVGFTDAMQDIVITGLFRPGRRHSGVPTVESLSEPWAGSTSGLTKG